MPQVVAVVAAIYTGTAVTTAMVVGAISQIAIAVSLAYSIYAIATMKSPDASVSGVSADVSGRTQVLRSAVAPHRVIYGKCEVSGPLVSAFSHGTDNKYVYLVIVLASHEVEEIGDVYLGDTLSINEKFLKTDGTSLVQITKYLGTATQTANAELIANAVDRNGNHVWTSAHTLSGRAYIIVRLEYDSTAFATGLPNVKAVVKGVNDIYDPRTGLTGWTDNAALCIRDYLLKAHGIGAASTDINDTNFIAAANICDELVSVRVGTGAGYTTDNSGYAIGRTGINLITGSGTIIAGDTVTITIPAGTYMVDGVSTEFFARSDSYVVETSLTSGYLVLAGDGLVAAIPPTACAVAVHTTNQECRYTCNGSFTVDSKPIDIMKKMLTSCAGTLVWSQGQYNLYPAAYNYPVGTIDESDLRDDIEILPAPSRSQRFNTVRGTFVSPDQYWQQVDFPYQQNAAQYAADGVEIPQTLDLTYTISAPMAQRIARIYLHQNIRGITLTWPGKLTCFKYQPGDVLYVNIAQLSWVNKEFRVTGWKLAENGGVDLVLKEEDPTVYTWLLADQKEYVPPAKTKISSYLPSVPDVTNFSASQNGSFVIFSWDESAVDIDGYEIRYNTIGNYTWDDGTVVTKVLRGTHLVSLKAAPGSWSFMIRAVDRLGNYSVNAAIYNLTVTNTNTIVYGNVGEAETYWSGTKTNLVEHWTGVLIPQSQGVAADDGWDTFNVFVPNPCATCTYEAAEMVLPYDYQYRAHGEILAVSSPIPVGIASPQLYIKWHKTGEAYNAYTAWSIGTILAKFVTMKFVIDTSVGVPIIQNFVPTVDAEPRTESGAAAAISSTGTAITFNTDFISIPVIQATAVGSSGLIAVLSNQSVSGFTAKVYDVNSGTPVSGTINWSAQGV